MYLKSIKGNEMKIALIGYGKMGHLVEEIAIRKGHFISSVIELSNQITENTLKDADVCIDFSHPDSAMENIQRIASLKKNLVMGTTGWYDHLDRAKAIIHEHGIGFLYSPNFSLGINLFLQIVQEAALLMDPFKEYDIGGIEYHHNQKVDSPSGTAKEIANTILTQMHRKKKVLWETPSRALEPDEIHFASVRNGSIPGTHTVMFDSLADTITLTHQARNREGFASGAVCAAEWLKGKKGFFTIQDLLQ
jgi:4-hydroxy-tetrahydrodipicolinate reductase